MKNECKIVQDLLPSYIENINSAETNEFIEEHFSNCEECRKKYRLMNENLRIESKVTKDEVKYMKKFNNRFKILLTVLMIIAIIFVIIISRKAIILNYLMEKTEKAQNMNNYYVNCSVYEKDKVLRMKGYKKEEASLSTLEMNYGKEYKKYTFYTNQKEKLYIEEGTGRVKVDSNEGTGIYTGIYSLKGDILTSMDYLRYLFFSHISTVNLEGKKCYLIKIDNRELFMDAETGMRVKFIDNNLNLTIDESYEFGTVSNELVQKPDLEAYSVKEE